MEDMDLSQFKEIFVSEAKEHLVALNSGLVELEKNPGNQEMLNQIFRAAHTLKGMAATMGFDTVTQLTHRMEDVLDAARKNQQPIPRNAIDAIFKCFDVLEKMIDSIEAGTDATVDISGLLQLLDALFTTNAPSQPPPQAPTAVAPPVPVESEKKKDATPPSGPVTPVLEQPAREPEDTDSFSAAKKAKTSIRINTSYLDTMMNLVGEMVISKSQLEQIAGKHRIEELTEALQQFDRIAVDLQEAVLQTRMVTLSHIFDRYPRMVRDLAQKLGKDILFDIAGADIEIDRVLLDEINEPLVHLLRNALDHGLESTAERQAAGKPAQGKILLTAHRERGYIVIEVRDDGKGLDPQVLTAKAIEKGILTAEAASALSQEELFMIICDPRFSTAKEVSDISGRGVGMDVVKNTIEAINGHIIIDSKKGVGSTFSLFLPLTMAIISSLMVRVGHETYALPLNNITEIVSYDPEIIKSISGKEVVVIRDEVIPLIRFSEKVNITTPAQRTAQGYILRIEAGNKTAGMLVNDFIGRKEVVIKTLTGVVKRARGFSGATILGDGSVVLIIDPGYWV